MSKKSRTGEWLREARTRANLTIEKLAELAGVHSSTVQFVETGKRGASPKLWAAFDAVLRPRVPLMYLDEDALIADARNYALLEGKGSLCRLFCSKETRGANGLVFVGIASVAGVRSDQVEDPDCPYVTLSWADAIKLLEDQRAALKRGGSADEA